MQRTFCPGGWADDVFHEALDSQSDSSRCPADIFTVLFPNHGEKGETNIRKNTLSKTSEVQETQRMKS